MEYKCLPRDRPSAIPHSYWKEFKRSLKHHHWKEIVGKGKIVLSKTYLVLIYFFKIGIYRSPGKFLGDLPNDHMAWNIWRALWQLYNVIVGDPASPSLGLLHQKYSSSHTDQFTTTNMKLEGWTDRQIDIDWSPSIRATDLLDRA